MSLRDFFGILPPRIQYTTESSQTGSVPMPETVVLTWRDASPADVGVRVGESVETGQNLARNGGSPLVAKVTGQIESIEMVPAPNGVEELAVTIAAAPKDVSPKALKKQLKPTKDFSEAGCDEILGKLAIAGFSDVDLLSLGAEALVISALDANPLATVNQQALRDSSEQFLNAVELLKTATGIAQPVLAVPENLTDAGSRAEGVRVVTLPAVYPNGLPELLARSCGAGTLLKKIGDSVVGNTLVVGLERALAMAECLSAGKILTEKNVSCSSGADVRNFRVRIGAPISSVLAEMGETTQAEGKVIVNGVMSGYACFSTDQPITETCDSIHIQPATEVYAFEDARCTNCGKCNRICPVDLEVNMIGRFAEYGLFDKCRTAGVANCVECGLCAYVCPARRPLVQLMTYGKIKTDEHGGQAQSLKEALECNACGPSCPAIHLFDMSPDLDEKKE